MVRIAGLVRSAGGFEEQARVLNPASNLICEVLGESGRPARIASGTNAPPSGMAVEIEAIAEIRTPPVTFPCLALSITSSNGISSIYNRAIRIPYARPLENLILQACWCPLQYPSCHAWMDWTLNYCVCSFGDWSDCAQLARAGRDKSILF
ncbi:RidA family protein (plasmid) [Sinorhizobium meliloti]|nr:RidA family protein [Sinorhizobium meliloti]CCM69721.1 unnamed protein product [Sinorhizobium meliloti Rm41]